MKQNVIEVVKGCPQCNARNPSQGQQKPLLQPEERTGIPWERVVLDFADMAHSDERFSKLIVLIDHATKIMIARAKVIFEDLICRELRSLNQHMFRV